MTPHENIGLSDSNKARVSLGEVLAKVAHLPTPPAPYQAVVIVTVLFVIVFVTIF